MFIMAIPIWQIVVLIVVVVVFICCLIFVLCFSVGLDCMRIYEDRGDKGSFRFYYYNKYSVVCSVDEQGTETIVKVVRGQNWKAICFWRSLKWVHVPEPVSRKFDDL